MTAADPTETVLRPGDLVDHFKVVRLVGRGGMGEVYLARDTKLGRKVALKVVKPDVLGDEQAVERFLFEAQVTARFSHPHIVAIHAVGEHRGCPFVALEFLEGQTLRERIADQRPGVRETLRIGLAVAEALAEAHQHDILHRDLKPENVLLPRDGRVRVVDFGLAKALFGAEAEQADTVAPGMTLGSQSSFGAQFQTSGEGIAGTPLYMAPEQWLEQDCTPATDVWALGVILYELLAGQRPHDAPTVFALCGLVCNMDAPTPPLNAEGVPAELVALVERCLDKDPGARPATTELVETLYRLIHRGRGEVETEASPFRGLLPFTERHADLFFGREGEIGAFVERLRDEPVLPVVGPSGAGKSSFVQAGVIPRLREQGRWLVLTLRPGGDPFAALASRLSRGESTGADTEAVTRTTGPNRLKNSVGAEVTSDQLAGLLREAPGRLSLFLTQVAEQQRSRVLLLVDQLEELYTLVEDEDERRAFMAAVCGAADDPDGPVRVVFTARDDFLGKLAESQAAREALSRVTVLRAPGTEAMREILLQPVACAGYGYDDDGLVDEMLAAVQGEAAGLPLLQFACAQLWERRNKNEKLLERAAYESIGGVEGALAHHADGVLEGLTTADGRIAREIFLRLVTGEGTRRTVTRGQLLAGLGDGASVVLDRLIQTRTITLRKSRRGDTDDAELELAHESLIRSWTRLRRWIEESHEDLAFLDEVRNAAELWVKRGRRGDEAWTGEALHDALRKAERIEGLPDEISAFLAAGRARDTRRARRKRIMLGTTIFLLALGAVVMALMYREARQQKVKADQAAEETRARHADAVRDAAEADLEQGEPRSAAAKLRFALEQRDTMQGRALWSRLQRASLLWSIETNAVTAIEWSPSGDFVALGLGGQRGLVDSRLGETKDVAQGPTEIFLAASFAANGQRWAACGNVVVISDSATGEEQQRWPFVGPNCMGLAFAPGERELLTVDTVGGLRIWDVERAQVLAVPEVRARSFSASRSGLIVAIDRATSRVGVYRIGREGLELERVLGDEPAAGVDITDDGKLIGVLRDRAVVEVWEAAGERLTRRVELPTALLSLRLHPGGQLVAGIDRFGDILLVDLIEGRVIDRFDGAGAETVVSFDARGERLAVGGVDGLLRAWKIDTEQRTVASLPHDGIWFTAAADPAQGVLASTVAGNPEILLWDRDGEQLRALAGHDADIYGLAFGPDGTGLASASADQTARLWDPSTGALVRIFSGHEGTVRDVDFSHDGALLATAADDGSARLWDVHTGLELRRLDHGGTKVFTARFSPDGTEVGTGTLDGVLRRWDVQTGAELAVLARGVKSGVRALAYSPDGATIAGPDADGGLALYDLRSGAATPFEVEIPNYMGAPFRYTEIEFSPDGKLLAVCPGDTHPRRVWEVQTRTELGVVFNGMGPGRVFHFAGPDRLVSEDCASLRLWDTALRPLWFSRALTATPPRVLTHRGWVDPGSGEPREPPAAVRWRTAVEERSLKAYASRGGELVCSVTPEHELELWNVAEDRPVASMKVDPLAVLGAFSGGCVVLESMFCQQVGGSLVLLTRDGVRKELMGCPNGLSILDDEVLARTEHQLVVFDRDGVERLRLPLRLPITAMARLPGGIVAQINDGELLQLTDGDTPLTRPRSLGKLPSSDPLQTQTLRPGPGDTLIFVTLTGRIGVMHRASGALLDSRVVTGRPAQIFLHENKLYVSTVVGDHTVLDLTDYARDYCDLLREVWDQVPIVWQDGKAVLAEPPTDHECARTTN